MSLVIQQPTDARLTLAKNFTWNETVWNPSMLQTALWLDAADASTITESGGAVSQWDDKSGNNRNATAASQPTLSVSALNGLNAISFDGATNYFSLALPLPLANTGSFDIFCLAQPNLTGRNTMWGAGIVRQYPGGDVPGSWFASIKGGGGIAVNDQSGGSQGRVFGGTITSLSNTVLHWSCNSAGVTAADRWTMRINAGNPVSESVGDAATGWATGNGEIGRSYPSGQYYYFGLIYEIIATTSEATASIRQKIEGYLAHKWGLTANLPAGHPYKTVGPTP